MFHYPGSPPAEVVMVASTLRTHPVALSENARTVLERRYLLRDATGAPMGDCKKALTESNGDQKAALEYLQKKSLASAQKKAGRAATAAYLDARAP